MKSLKEGVLTITLTNGTLISGLVTENTEIRCATSSAGTGDDADEQSGSGDAGHSTGDSSTQGPTPTAHEASDGGGDGGDQQEADEEQSSCGTTALTEGAMVREAELKVSSSGAVWEQVDLM